ncbi:hypothetical protein AB0J71_02855 [Nonomuraea sp. NPDC049637]|uniref:hypothetical protein n=1 Tax=Nonomuraea sp. NPDC049637 TaxID=3154356 RepID=UPI0034406A65
MEGYQRMREHLRDHPANRPWRRRMAEHLEATDDYSGDGDAGLRLVRHLWPPRSGSFGMPFTVIPSTRIFCLP